MVDAAYSSQRQCGEEVWHKLVAPKLPDAADITQAAGMMRLAKPKQKRHLAKLEKLAESLELREFGSLVDDTLVSNIAAARRTRTEVKYYRAPFPEGLDDSFDILYAAVRTTVLSLLNAQNEATGTVLAAYDHHVTQLKQTARALGFDDVAIRLASQFASLDHRVLSSRMDGAIDHRVAGRVPRYVAGPVASAASLGCARRVVGARRRQVARNRQAAIGS